MTSTGWRRHFPKDSTAGTVTLAGQVLPLNRSLASPGTLLNAGLSAAFKEVMSVDPA